MTLLENVRESIIQHKEASIRPRHLLLAYLVLHMKNPGLHPDDYLYDGSGYEGWMVILCHLVLGRTSKRPDTFEYPNEFLKLADTLNELHDFHTALANDDPDDDMQMNYLIAINDTLFWLDEMKPSELDGIVDNLQYLHLYHAFEEDTEEEEAEKPAVTLKTCADVLNWIQTK